MPLGKSVNLVYCELVSDYCPGPHSGEAELTSVLFAPEVHVLHLGLPNDPALLTQDFLVPD